VRAPRISVGGRPVRERSIEQAATALTRRIVQREKALRKLRAKLAAAIAEARAAIRADKRELRTLLQRAATIELDTLDVAGKADGADRAIALAEQRAHDKLVSTMCQELADQSRCAFVEQTERAERRCTRDRGHEGRHHFATWTSRVGF
jgi:hypothetical protein